MPKQQLKNSTSLNKLLKPNFLDLVTEREMGDSFTCNYNLPLFYSTQDQREMMNKAMSKAEEISER